MRVNSAFRAILGNRFAVWAGVVTIFVFFTTSFFTAHSKSDLLEKRVNIIIRNLGHHLLLQSGDSTSRVLPVKETADGVLLEFENELVFKPDTLVALTQRLLSETDLKSDYTVTVHECNKPDIIYGFQISSTTNDIKPCNGRSQPHGCYKIEIAFANFNASTLNPSSTFLLVSCFLVLFTVGIFFQPFHKGTTPLKVEGHESASITDMNENLPRVGKFAFDAPNQCLLFNDQRIALTDKECKILELLNQNFGNLTSRENLIKQIWTDEGVITGRSLDMFVSKLRKKLSGDTGLRITNIHGKGYKLEMV